MARFKDANSREWVLRVNVNVLRRVRDRTDEDLTRVIETDFLQRVSRDPVLFGSILYALVEDQAIKAGVDEAEFLSGLEGDAMESAGNAFMEALVAFFPNPRRALMEKVLRAGKAQTTLLHERAEKELDAALGVLSMKLPGASESTPALSASEN
jgi:hypothetical protein